MIGIIDSGFGGLSIVAELQKQNKMIPFVYIGDNKHVPYGLKSSEEIKKLAFKMIAYLMDTYQIDGLIVACNTIVAACIEDIKEVYPSLYIENIVAHGALGALQSFHDKVAVLATKKTVDSGIYTKYIQSFSEEVTVTEIAASNWVTMVENQTFDIIEIKKITETIPKNVDVVILGCTHFPFLYSQIRSHLSKTIQIIDPAYSCVQQLVIDDVKDGASIFLTTGEVATFTDFLSANALNEKSFPVEKIEL